MKAQRYTHPDVAALRCGLIGACLIAVGAAVTAWVMFVLTERWAREEVARQLEGGWVASDGKEMWFGFPRGAEGTMEVWTPGAGSVTTPAGIAWTRADEVAVAVPSDAGGQELFSVYFNGERDMVRVLGGPAARTPTLFRRMRQLPSAR